VKFPKDKVLELKGAGKLAALVGTDATAVFVAMVVEELADDIQQGFLGGREKDPDVSSGFIND
jgi:hypothetical protein